MKAPALRIASWNVRTMCRGLSNNLSDVEDYRKTAIIDRELKRLNISIAALQETRLADSGCIAETNYTFFWKGRAPKEPHQHGVGFAIKNTLLASIESPSDGTEHLLSIRMNTSTGAVNFLNVYAPTLAASAGAKDEFYDQLDDMIKKVPNGEPLFLLGDFNARVGAYHDSWPVCIGQFGVGKMNENGQRLLELCTHHNLCITNTFFNCKSQHKVSWMHPPSDHWYQLDMIITRRSLLSSVLVTRSYHSADCDTDHALVGSRVRLQPQKLHRHKPKGCPSINGVGLHSSSWKVKEYVTALMVALKDLNTQHQSATERWNAFKEIIYQSASTSFGKKKQFSYDWFNAYRLRMEPAIETKQEAFLNYKRHPCQSSLIALRNARSNT